MELSIIICTYNRAQFLPDALESLKKQKLKKDKFEIVLINNNSTDATENISKIFEKQNPELNFQYHKETSQGLSYARNKGIEVAKGKIIAFIDDDAIAEPDYAENILRVTEEFPDYTGFGGKVSPIYPNKTEPVWMSKYIQGLVSKVDYGEKTGPFDNKKYPVGCNMIFRREVFDELGAFNVDLKFRSDDKFIFLKLREHKKNILYAPTIAVHHNIDASRLTYDFIVKLCIQIGATEKIRLKNNFYTLFSKFIEYIWKQIASFILFLIFILQGKKLKAKYIIMVRWYILIGFFRNAEYIQQKYEK
ncbi:MAG: glycosyltransferase [Bacteroidota bacterium]|nr:glycosyltransferase [Bacteroidota bacterium]